MRNILDKVKRLNCAEVELSLIFVYHNSCAKWMMLPSVGYFERCATASAHRKYILNVADLLNTWPQSNLTGKPASLSKYFS